MELNLNEVFDWVVKQRRTDRQMFDMIVSCSWINLLKHFDTQQFYDLAFNINVPENDLNAKTIESSTELIYLCKHITL